MKRRYIISLLLILITFGSLYSIISCISGSNNQTNKGLNSYLFIPTSMVNTPFLNFASFSNSTIICTNVSSEQDGTFIEYGGSASYGDERNVQVVDDDCTYLGFGRLGEGNVTTYLEYTIPNKYYSIDNITILLRIKRSVSVVSLNTSVYNYTSSNFVDIDFLTGNSDSYDNETKVLTNSSYNLMDFQSPEKKVLLRLNYTATLLVSWRIDYTELQICGIIDEEPPTINEFSMERNSPCSNETIKFSLNATDNLSGLKTEQLFLFDGNVGLPENMTFIITKSLTEAPLDPTTSTGSFGIKLPVGNWTVTAMVTDNDENQNNETLVFEVLLCTPPTIIIISNTNTALRYETIEFTVLVQSGSNNLDDVWLYDGFLDTNITIDSNINNQSTLLYKYYSSSSSLGSFSFSAYVNDSLDLNDNFTILDDISVIADPTDPIVRIEHINSTHLGVDHGIQINISISTLNQDFNLSVIQIFDPIENYWFVLSGDIGDNNTHFYLYNTTSNITGTYYFTVYGNDTNGNDGSDTDYVTWVILEIKPIIDVYIDSIAKLIGSFGIFFITVEGTEYSLDDIWMTDPVTQENVTITSNLDTKDETVLEFAYGIAYIGVKTFVFFVNDTYNNIQITEIDVVGIVITSGPSNPPLAYLLIELGIVSSAVVGMYEIYRMKKKKVKHPAIVSKIQKGIKKRVT